MSFARGIGGRMSGRRMVNSAAAPFNGNFGGLLSGVLLYVRGDLGLTKTSTIVNAWANQQGTSSGITEGTATVGIGTAGTGLNGHASIIANGTTQFGTHTQLLTAPSTTPYSFHFVVRLLNGAGGGNQFLTGDTNNESLIYQPPASSNIQVFNGSTSTAVSGATNTWALVSAIFTGSASDYLKFGSGAAVSSPFGAAASTQTRGIFANQIGGSPSNVECLLILLRNGASTLGDIATIGAGLDAFYGPGSIAY